MYCKKLSRDSFDIYLEKMNRYNELNITDHTEKINTAAVIINYAIQDINRNVKEVNKLAEKKERRYSTRIFYELVIKTDHIIHSVDQVSKIMKIKNDKNIAIEKFRRIRSLTLAHPLETTRYENQGFGSENIKWCEDVRPFNPLFNYKDKTGDFYMVIKEQGKDLPEQEAVSIEKDILETAKIAIKRLDLISNEFEVWINKQTEFFQNKDIFEGLEKFSNDGEYLEKLFIALKERYPSKVEVINYADGKIVENSIIDDIKARLLLHFENEKRNETYKVYRNELKIVVEKFAVQLQDMSLNEEIEYGLRNIFFPTVKNLEKTAEMDLTYINDKIHEYLNNSDDFSFYSIQQRNIRSESELSNSEFSFAKIYDLLEYLTPYFDIDLNSSDRIIAIQYYVALFLLNRKHDVK
ncbi:TPA: hypothetical protein ACNIAK_002277 [Enterococcus faecalis]|nr:hypothetical protein [Enterococcus faecalis]EMC0698332.1 hypothetical protein [Enterococcus faecalis]MCD5130346.1 hypothetical protein [Enterococcus faecalis]MDV2557259.1 hypothetical protein [Enterococcus faecalis]MDY2531882.1 hypothetical protein [Enterococcus faecalis]UQQ63187.1 hypothetical protein LQ054_04685 [Enterococcus faecalis]